MEHRFIGHLDPFLEKVIILGKRNSATLGLMPRDAYVDHARKKCIVIVFEDETLLGFCLFRIVNSKNRVGITQVCIDEHYRNNRIPKLLLDAIQEKYKYLLSGMLVSCREDYISACKLWIKYGFTILKRIRSRSIEEKYLLKFWFDFGKPNLFTAQDDNSNLRVILDLNIVIKLKDDTSSEEVHFLLSDWLTDEVDFYYTKETLNEIHRDKDHKRTEDMLVYLNGYQTLSSHPEEAQKYIPTLEHILPGKSVNHISDRKQLAECRACGIEYFITIDEGILAKRDEIYDALYIRTLRPSEFILEIDELKNKRLYEPVRLQGARYDIQKVNSTQLAPSIDKFLDNGNRDKRTEFRKLVLTTVSDSPGACTKIVISPDNQVVCLFGFKYESESIVVKFVRVEENSMQNTLFSQILTELIREALRSNKPVINIEEKYLSDDFEAILIRNGFFKSETVWHKLVLPYICSSQELLQLCPDLERHEHFSETLPILKGQQEADDRSEILFSFERKLWPLKFSDLERPIFIVPIKPYWASQMFDSISANALIFGSAPELSWSRENVYYRSVKPDIEQFPGIILWYASDARGFTRKKGIVACSYLNNVTIGAPKQLFTIFKRYGIYKWPEIFDLAKRDIKRAIKVLQFSDTEVFDTPIKLETVHQILVSENFKKNTFMSPVKVSKEVFNKIYKAGKRIK